MGAKRRNRSDWPTGVGVTVRKVRGRMRVMGVRWLGVWVVLR